MPRVKRVVLVSTLVSVLTSTFIQGLNLREKTEASLELTSFLLHAASLCCDKKVTTPQYCALLRHLKDDAFAYLLGINPATFSRFVDKESLVKLLVVCAQQSTAESKAEALMNLLKREALDEEYHSPALKKALKPFAQLCFFEGPADEKKEVLRKFKQALVELKQENNGALSQLIPVERLIALVTEALEGKSHDWKKILMSWFQEKSIQETYIHRGNLLELFSRVLEGKDLAPMLFINCMRWDSLFADGLSVSAPDNELVNKLFDTKRLQLQIQRFQDNQPLDPAALQALLKTETSEPGSRKQDILSQYIDFTKLARGLEKVRRGVPAPELQEVVQCDLIKEKTGIDLKPLFIRTVPQEIQEHQLNKVIALRNNPEIARNLHVAACTILLYTCFLILAHQFDHSGMSSLEPQQWYTAWPLCVILYYLAYRVILSYQNLSPLKIVSTNIAYVKIAQQVKKLINRPKTTHETVLSYISQDDEQYEAIKEFLAHFTEDQLQKLSHPASIYTLLQDPYNFMRQEEDFIDELCTPDAEHPDAVDQRVELLKAQLEEKQPYNSLAHAQSYTLFMNALPENDNELYSHLPHKKILMLARYRPTMLLRYPNFLKAASDIKLGYNDLTSLLITKILPQAYSHEKTSLKH